MKKARQRREAVSKLRKSVGGFHNNPFLAVTNLAVVLATCSKPVVPAERDQALELAREADNFQAGYQTTFVPAGGRIAAPRIAESGQFGKAH